MEICAYHESGHAVMAILHKATVNSVSIAPDWDEGPRREGEVEIHWPTNLDPRTICHASIEVALAGPVAEMIYTGDPFHPALVQEWSGDWSVAWELAGQRLVAKARRMLELEMLTRKIYQTLSDDRLWQAIAALSDELLAHEILEQEEIYEAVSRWL